MINMNPVLADARQKMMPTGSAAEGPSKVEWALHRQERDRARILEQFLDAQEFDEYLRLKQDAKAQHVAELMDEARRRVELSQEAYAETKRDATRRQSVGAALLEAITTQEGIPMKTSTPRASFLEWGTSDGDLTQALKLKRRHTPEEVGQYGLGGAALGAGTGAAAGAALAGSPQETRLERVLRRLRKQGPPSSLPGRARGGALGALAGGVGGGAAAALAAHQTPKRLFLDANTGDELRGRKARKARSLDTMGRAAAGPDGAAAFVPGDEMSSARPFRGKDPRYGIFADLLR